VDGERKMVTALFADIKGSMELMEDLDPEAARAIVDPALKLMIEAVRRYGGYVVQSTGDGIFALFGAPVAHEDHPQRALYAALRLQEEMRRYSGQLRQAGNMPVEARVGVNTGDVVVRSIATGDGHPEYTPIGHSTNLAARMQALAPTGSIAATDGTRKLCEGYFSFRALGPTRVKGVSEPVEVFEVTGLGPLRTRLQVAARRGLTKFVGREREMQALKHAAELAKSGHGQLVAAMGEPGAGKSRLFHEFKLVSQSEWMTLEAFSISHGKASAYLPLIDLLHGYFEITSEDDGRKRREKVGGKVLMLDRTLEDALPYLFSLLGIADTPDPMAQMDGQVKKRRTLEAIKRMLSRESLDQPLMLIFEDLHWIDGETQALLNLLVDAIANARILLLVNYRPEYHHEWGNRTYYNQLRLDPLGRESADQMLNYLLGGEHALTALKRLIIERTESNPFFMEETVQALLEQGVLVRNGEVKLTKSLRDLKIPVTVQAMLSARIDRLPPAEKELLQTLAVIGKELALELVEGVTGKREDQLESMLTDLQLGEFIYEQPSSGGPEYTFKHALTQEVAYNSVLMERRKTLHERTGQAIETLYEEHLDDYLDGLAYHYSRSANVVKAVNYLHLAARQCAMRTADFQALAYLDRGLELLRSLPEGPERYRQELDVQIARGQSLHATQGFAAPETGRTFGRARELCARFGNRAQLFSVLYGLRLFARWGLELEIARQLEEQLVAIAEELNDPAKLVQAHGSLGAGLLWLGELSAAQKHLEWAKDITGPAKDVPFQTAASLSLLAWDLAILGYFEQAMKISEQVFAWVQSLSRPFTLAITLRLACEFDQLRRDDEAALKHSGKLLQVGAEYGFRGPMAIATVIHGWATSCHGEAESGIVEMRRGIDDNAATGARAPSWLLVPLVETWARSGQIIDAEHLLDEVIATVQQTHERMQEAELYRLKGELGLKTPGNEAEAEICFRQAIEVAQRQSAKWWELRAGMSLARLLRDTNRRDEAHTMLAEIYNWFTEGFDLPDLKEAKALLEELGRGLE
jgi:class 3 adenylate cyclase/tetratricopeptide (TPR) repeat protein